MGIGTTIVLTVLGIQLASGEPRSPTPDPVPGSFDASKPDGAAPQAPGLGYSLRDRWDGAWRRVLDRHGRPDPDGPVQQRFPGNGYPEYRLNLLVPAFPLRLERAWAVAPTGARLWVHSLDELTLVNRIQLKTRAEMGGGWQLGLRFDREESQTAQSDLFRVDFAVQEIADTHLFAGLSFYPRWDKEDSDAEAQLGYRRPGWGSIRLRVFSLDTYVNASHGILRARDALVDEELKQVDLPLALALEVDSAEIARVRAEAYLGSIVSQGTRHRFAADPGADHIRTREGLLAGGLLQWRVPLVPLLLGVDGLWVHTRMGWDYEDAGTSDRTVEERTGRMEIFAIAELPSSVSLEAQIVGTWRPETIRVQAQPELDSERSDREWLWSLRGLWMPSTVVGVELGVLRLQRETDGPPEVPLAGTNHRALTRVVLQLGDVWAAFGAGWDLDPGTIIYDGGGMTLTATF